MKKLTFKQKQTRSIWVDMWRRCTDPRRKDFSRYGAKGITVCEAWKSFEQFYSDMGEKPEGRTLDRVDNSLGYSKDNCRWATKLQQDWNRGTYSSNTSGVKGVRFNTQTNSWQAFGMYRGRQEHLYLGPSKEQAILARKAWEDRILALVEGEAP